MNVYILLDTSGSIAKTDFEKSREATIALIRKVCVKCYNKKVYPHWDTTLSVPGCETYMSSSFSF